LDELTAGFLRRQLRLKGRLLAALGLGSLALGLLTPREDLASMAALVVLLAAWFALGGAASDRADGPMASILAAPHARRPWLVAFFTAASLVAGLAAFSALLPSGFRPALVAGMLALAYGWMVAALGLSLLLRVRRPREAHRIGALALAVLLAAPSPAAAAMKGTAWVWHPVSLFKVGLSQALYITGGSPGSPTMLGMIRDLPLHGIILPLLLSLVAWRWTLRALDRMEMLTQ
jgi:uncharacterized membrane protein HdeD (DUF308 family)